MHVAIIMDGNRRWAKARGLPTVLGHREGFKKLKEVAEWSEKNGVDTLTVFAFSTENWKRSEEEVDALIQLFREGLKEIDAMKREDGRIRFIGRREDFAPDIIEEMNRIEERTKDGKGFTFVVALSYGGRAEILDAINRIPHEKRGVMTEDDMKELLWTSDLSDPDLLIRTSGEKRTSGFLPWQAVYSELAFTDTLWPDLTEKEYLHLLEDYKERERRYGK